MAKTVSGKFWIRGLIGLALALVNVGCGDDGNSLAEFQGTWKYIQSPAQFSCPGDPVQTGSFGTTKDWRQGVKSALVDFSTNCDYRFDVNGKVASIQKTQTCDLLDNNGDPASEAPNSWVFTLTSATTAEEKVETVTTFIDGVSCTLTATMSTLEKISKD